MTKGVEIYFRLLPAGRCEDCGESRAVTDNEIPSDKLCDSGILGQGYGSTYGFGRGLLALQHSR
jgi:hypothetical protein